MSPKNVVVICVDGWRNKDIYGRLYTKYWRSPKHFSSTITLIMEMNRFYDEINFPQPDTELRSFHPKKEDPPAYIYHSPAEPIRSVNKWRGLQITFRVSVAFRMNSTWQGYAELVGTRQIIKFRSELELFHFLDRSLGGKKSYHEIVVSKPS